MTTPKIIKGASDPGAGDTAISGTPRSRSVVPAPEVDAHAGARRIVEEARSRAAEIVAAAEVDAERLRGEAAEQGLLAGRAEAAAILARARSREAEILAGAEADLANLARRMAEKILGRALSSDPHALADVVGEVLRDARRARQIVLRVHPDDAAALERDSARLAATVGRSGAIQIRPDPAVGPGGCRVESDLGTIDGRLETQLDALERALAGDPDEGRREPG